MLLGDSAFSTPTSEKKNVRGVQEQPHAPFQLSCSGVNKLTPEDESECMGKTGAAKHA